MMLKVVGALALVSAISQILQLLAQPVLAQLYIASDFGEFAQISSVVMFATVLTTMQFHNYLVMVKEDRREFDRIFSLSILFGAVASVIFGVVLCFFGGAVFGEGGARAGIFSGILVFLMSVGAVVKGGLISQGDFSGLMWFTIVRSLFLVAIQLLCGWLDTADGLIKGLIFGEFSALLLMTPFIKKHFAIIAAIDFLVGVKKAFIEKKDFLLVGTIQELVSVASFALPLYMFSRLYGSVFGGQFALAHKMSWTPVLLVSQSISSVLFRYLSDKSKLKARSFRYFNPWISLSLMGCIGYLGFLIFPWLFWEIFGADWEGAANISAWLVIWAASFLVSVPYRLLYRVYSAQRLQLLIDVVTLAATLFVFFMDQFSAEQAVYLLSIFGVIQNSVLILVAYFVILKVNCPAYRVAQ